MMGVLYIDSNEVMGGTFCRAVLAVSQSAWCEIANDRIKTINVILDNSLAPDYIFIHAHFRDIPCRTLVSLIKKQSHLDNTKIIVVAEYVTLKDLQMYQTLNVQVRLKARDIESLLDEILKK